MWRVPTSVWQLIFIEILKLAAHPSRISIMELWLCWILGVLGRMLRTGTTGFQSWIGYFTRVIEDSLA